MEIEPSNPRLRRVVGLVAILNLAYFGVEFAVATAIGSVSLFADSVDFLEDTSVNLLILFALGWTARQRARIGMLLAGILLVPGLATLWTAWEKFHTPVARNDAFANIAIIAAGLITAFFWRSAWPDLIVGLSIALMNADAAREVWGAARTEHRAAS